MFFRRRRERHDFREEIQSHLDLDRDELIREGVPPEDAPAAARRRFGNLVAVGERHYESGRLLWLDRLRQDIRCSMRSLAKYPIASAVAILSLAAGIGSTTATLTVRNTVFRNPPPLYTDPGQLSEVFTVTPRGFRQSVPAALYRVWTAEPRPDQVWAAATADRREDVRTDAGTVALSIRAVTPNLFALLGVEPLLGTTPADKDKGGTVSVIISHAVWQRLFESRTDVIGQALWINEQPYRVAAVMPERFWFLDTGGYIWTPLDIDAVPADTRLTALVRRPSGLSTAALRDTLASGVAEYAQHLPEPERALRASLSGVGGTALGRAQSLFFPYLLGGCVVLTWLIACANVAILTIARWTAREHEIAVRAALGAGRGRLVQLLLAESLVIAAAGGLLGVGVTFALRNILVRNAPMLVYYDTSISPSVLMDAILLTLVTGLLAGLGPALYETRRLHANPLVTMTSERLRQRWRHALVVAEITATAALLVVTGQMVEGYRRHVTADVGFPTDALAFVRVESPTGVRAADLLAFVTGIPGISSAAAASSAPFTGHDSTLHSVAQTAGGLSEIKTEVVRVSPTFFTTLDVPIRTGRGFTSRDVGSDASVALVNETLARRLWDHARGFDQRLWLDGRAYDVIGIVADYLYGPVSLAPPSVFVPLAPDIADTRLQLVLRGPATVGPLADQLRREIPRVVNGHTVTNTTINARDWITLGGREILAGTAPLVPLITIGLLLTVSGVYAVLAFAVARRAKEFALRSALGASRRDLIRLVSTHSLRLITIGSALGIALTYALTRVVRASGGAGSMFDTPGWPAFALPMLTMFVVGAMATWLPARRALRAEPAVLLRVD